MIVPVVVEGQSLRWYGRIPEIADNSIEFVQLEFRFPEDWDGMVIVAQFTQTKTYNCLLVNNRCFLPMELVAGPCEISVFGYLNEEVTRGTTIPLKLNISRSGFVSSAETPIPPTPDLYAQLIEYFSSIAGSGGGGSGSGTINPEDIAAAVEDYLSKNPPEVPDLSDEVTRAETAASDAEAAADRAEEAAKVTTDLDTTLTQEGKAADAKAVGDAISKLSGGNVELDTTLTQSGKAADAKAVGDKIAEITGISLIEPADDDIPKVYFTGTLPTSKTEDGERLTMHYISKTADFTYPVTLKVQGSSSANYAKKNFTLKPYKDSTYEKKQKLKFKGWPEMNKFVLKAHWIDHSHVRNVGSAKIWGKIVKSRSDYDSLPEELRNAPNNGATDGFTVKVFANGVYQGLYEWIVAKDKLFGQDSDIATHSILNSEWNNQPTCAFATTSPTINGNWSEELQDGMTADTKVSMENWIKFVAGSTDEEFVANAESYFDVQSVIDADIFDRVFCTVDNLCRNQIVFKYDSKWFVGKWDLDAVLGLPPVAGGSFFAYNTEYQTGYLAYKNYGITNLLYQRVENLFRDRFKARYWELRSGVLSIENILDVYERLTDVITTYDGLLNEDYASTTGGGAFTGIPYKTENTIQQIRNFVAQRIPYMDGVIAEMIDPVPCTGISLSASELTFTEEGTQTLTATVSPDDCTYDVVWVSSNPSVATISVDGNVCTVNAVANGDTTITVTCGDYSASCAVSVSGLIDPVPCTGILLSASSLTFTEIGSQTLVATVEPTDTTDNIEWSVNPSGVVTVDGGVVTAISAGSCVITAKCGEHSATCDVSVSLPVDYTLNPLANVEWQLDTGINMSTGALEAKTGENISTRFTLQNCVYNQVTPSGSSWPSIHMWDSSGAYAGYIQIGSGNIGEFTARSDYSYALGVANTATERDFSGASLMPVDKRANAVDTVSFTLSDFTWAKTGNGWETDITEALSTQGVTLTELRNGMVSANYIVRLNGVLSATIKNANPFFMLHVYSGKSLLIAKSEHSTVAEFQTWTEESGAVLTIN